jgi:prophage DNA circulation protein
VASAQGSGVTATQPFLIAHVSIQQTAAVASAAAQVFALAIDNPVLTPNDIQSITNDVRTNINTTITLARATWPNIVDHRPITEPLKALALSVYNAAEQLIQAKPPFTTRTVTTPGNLNLLAFLWYGDYTRADELFRLNPQIVNPNFITAGMVLSCYAK